MLSPPVIKLGYSRLHTCQLNEKVSFFLLYVFYPRKKSMKLFTGHMLEADIRCEISVKLEKKFIIFRRRCETRYQGIIRGRISVSLHNGNAELRLYTDRRWYGRLSDFAMGRFDSNFDSHLPWCSKQ